MKLGELFGVIEMSQTVAVYKTKEDGFCYQGMAAHVPKSLSALNVEAVQAYDWEIDVLVSEETGDTE